MTVSDVKWNISKSKNSMENCLFKTDIKWKNVLIIVYLHVSAIYACFLPMLRSSIIIGLVFGVFAGFGTTVGAHRLFTHRTFKANKILKMLMVVLQTMAGQEPVIRWVSDY